ncbi:MAG: glycosyltransferase family A protein [Muribaculaceae bacterium]|nr:glycosyltransferase family A protein [Muribaculaceae bacterium]
MNPTLTVIVPVFNRAHIVRDTLDSIARQRVAPDCLIVVDNNSTDASAETVKQWISEYSGPMRCEFASEPKPGSAAARNRGLALADTELVSFFDSDDKVRPDYAESIKEAFSSDPQLDLVYWAVKHHPIAGRPRRLRFSSRGDIAFQIFHSFLATQRFAVKRDFFIRVEGWDESVFVWNDWELGIRMLLHHPRMRSIPRVLADTYAQADSITGPSFFSRREKIEWALGRAEADIRRYASADRLHLLSLLDLRRAILAGLYRREGNEAAGRRLLAEAVESARLLPGGERLARLCRTAASLTSLGMRGADRLSLLV